MRNITYGLVKKHKRFNIYLVRSPFQLISAIEAKSLFQDSGSVLIIGPIYLRNGYRVINKLLEFEYFDKVIFIRKELSYFEGLRILLVAKLIIMRGRKIEYLFDGFPGYHIFEWIRRNIPSDNYFVLDDGTKSISDDTSLVFDNLDKITDANNEHSKSLKRFMKRLIFHNIKNTYKNIGIFSCFNTKKLQNIKYMHHNFEYLRSKIDNIYIDKGTVYFYGSPLSEENIIVLDDEIKLIKKILSKYGNYMFFYIPHPRDSNKKISYLISIGIDIKELNLPAEIDPIVNKSLPEIVVSFFSTVLISLSKIYNHSNIYSYRIDSEIITRKNKEIDMIYNELKNYNDIKVIRL